MHHQRGAQPPPPARASAWVAIGYVEHRQHHIRVEELLEPADGEPGDTAPHGGQGPGVQRGEQPPQLRGATVSWSR